MRSDEIKIGIVEALNNIGLFYTYDDLVGERLIDILVDSMSFMSFIVELESCFDIEIPDEYLLLDNLPDIDAVERMIAELTEQDD